MKHDIPNGACGGKQIYPNRGEALLVLERMRNRSRRRHSSNSGLRRSHTRLVPYQCRFCGHWNIGNQP